MQNYQNYRKEMSVIVNNGQQHCHTDTGAVADKQKNKNLQMAHVLHRK